MQKDSQAQPHPQFTRTYHNYSNIKFNDTEMIKIAPQSQNNFRSLSQVGGMMTDKIEEVLPSRSVYHYRNKIAQVERDYDMPNRNDPYFEKNNVRYEEYYCQAKKFVKPYTDCTKYSDNLMKNRQLLRRGQFDLPTEPIPPQTHPQKTKTSVSQVTSHIVTPTQFPPTLTTQYLKTKSLLKKTSETMQNIRKRKPSSDRKNGFDKTLKEHKITYHTLMNEQRKDYKDQMKLKNSMNRILAAEMINYRLMSQGDYVKPQSVRLDRERRQ